MHLKFFSFSVVIFTFFYSCKKETEHFTKRTDSTEISRDVKQNNSDIEELGKIIALAMEDKYFRDIIKCETGKQFDGDYDVLISSILKESSLASESFESYLIKAEEKRNTGGNIVQERLQNLISNFPNLQLSIPIHYEKWEYETQKPLVAVIPIGMNIENEKFVNAFDSKGNQYELNTQEEPDFPIIVLGFCERVDNRGKLKAEFDPSQHIENTNQENSNYKTSQKVYIKEFKAIDIHESWLYGKPEIEFDILLGTKYDPFLGVPEEAVNYYWDGGENQNYAFLFPDNLKTPFYQSGIIEIERDIEGDWVTTNKSFNLTYASSNPYFIIFWQESDSDEESHEHAYLMTTISLINGKSENTVLTWVNPCDDQDDLYTDQYWYAIDKPDNYLINVDDINNGKTSSTNPKTYTTEDGDLKFKVYLQ